MDLNKHYHNSRCFTSIEENFINLTLVSIAIPTLQNLVEHLKLTHRSIERRHIKCSNLASSESENSLISQNEKHDSERNVS